MSQIKQETYSMYLERLGVGKNRDKVILWEETAESLHIEKGVEVHAWSLGGLPVGFSVEPMGDTFVVRAEASCFLTYWSVVEQKVLVGKWNKEPPHPREGEVVKKVHLISAPVHEERMVSCTVCEGRVCTGGVNTEKVPTLYLSSLLVRSPVTGEERMTYLLSSEQGPCTPCFLHTLIRDKVYFHLSLDRSLVPHPVVWVTGGVMPARRRGEWWSLAKLCSCTSDCTCVKICFYSVGRIEVAPCRNSEEMHACIADWRAEESLVLGTIQRVIRQWKTEGARKEVLRRLTRNTRIIENFRSTMYGSKIFLRGVTSCTQGVLAIGEGLSYMERIEKLTDHLFNFEIMPVRELPAEGEERRKVIREVMIASMYLLTAATWKEWSEAVLKALPNEEGLEHELKKELVILATVGIQEHLPPIGDYPLSGKIWTMTDPDSFFYPIVGRLERKLVGHLETVMLSDFFQEYEKYKYATEGFRQYLALIFRRRLEMGESSLKVSKGVFWIPYVRRAELYSLGEQLIIPEGLQVDWKPTRLPRILRFERASYFDDDLEKNVVFPIRYRKTYQSFEEFCAEEGYLPPKMWRMESEEGYSVVCFEEGKHQGLVMIGPKTSYFFNELVRLAELKKQPKEVYRPPIEVKERRAEASSLEVKREKGYPETRVELLALLEEVFLGFPNKRVTAHGLRKELDRRGYSRYSRKAFLSRAVRMGYLEEFSRSYGNEYVFKKD